MEILISAAIDQATVFHTHLCLCKPCATKTGAETTFPIARVALRYPKTSSHKGSTGI